MPRLFTGIMLPERLQPELLAFLPTNELLRLPQPGQLHLTLHFHGNLSDEQTDALAARLPAVVGTPFQLRLARTGIFEHQGGDRGVLWAGVELSAPLQQLHTAVSRLLVDLELPLESQPWVPHVTLARYTGGPLASAVQFLNRGQRLAAEYTVDAFQLMQSTPGPRGSVYRPRAVVRLREPGDCGSATAAGSS